MPDDFSDLSDEELDAQLAGESSSDEGSEEQQAAQPETQPEQPTETVPEEGVAETEDLEWLPEEYRETWKADPKAAAQKISESYRHLHSKFGKYSKYSDVVALFDSDPEAYQKAVKAIVGEASPAQKPEPQQSQDPVDATLQKLKDAGYDPEVVEAFEMLANATKQQQQSVEQRFQQYQEQQRIAQAKEDNQKTFESFLEKNPMDTDDFVDFINKASRRVSPTGKNGAYTVADLESAQFVLDPQGYQKRLREQLTKELVGAMKQNTGEELPSAIPTQQDQTYNTVKKGASPNELSDADLDAELEKAGISSPKRARGLFNW